MSEIFSPLFFSWLSDPHQLTYFPHWVGAPHNVIMKFVISPPSLPHSLGISMGSLFKRKGLFLLSWALPALYSVGRSVKRPQTRMAGQTKGVDIKKPFLSLQKGSTTLLSSWSSLYDTRCMYLSPSFPSFYSRCWVVVAYYVAAVVMRLTN